MTSSSENLLPFIENSFEKAFTENKINAIIKSESLDIIIKFFINF